MSKLQLATKDDWNKILEMQNQDMEFNVISNKSISKKEHYQYLTKQELNPNFFHYFYDDIVYLVVKDNNVSITVPKEYRNNLPQI